MGELFPTKQRGILSSVAGSFNLLIMFIVIITYHPLEQQITTGGTFFLYSVLCLVGVFFVLFCVPETKGRNLEDIAQLFAKKSSPSKESVERKAELEGCDNLGNDIAKGEENPCKMEQSKF